MTSRLFKIIAFINRNPNLIFTINLCFILIFAMLFQRFRSLLLENFISINVLMIISGLIVTVLAALIRKKKNIFFEELKKISSNEDEWIKSKFELRLIEFTLTSFMFCMSVWCAIVFFWFFNIFFEKFIWQFY